jgi:hypothetical protein
LSRSHAESIPQIGTVVDCGGPSQTPRIAPEIAPTKWPRTNTPPAELRSVADDIRACLERRFAGQAGYLCLGWIDGDPDIERMVEEWYQWPHQARQIVDRYVVLAERGHNLYIGLSLHQEPKRSYATAHASAWLWVDDAAIDGAELIESSEGNYQLWHYPAPRKRRAEGCHSA